MKLELKDMTIVGVKFEEDTVYETEHGKILISSDIIYPVQEQDGMLLTMRDGVMEKVQVAEVGDMEVVFFESDEGCGFMFIRD